MRALQERATCSTSSSEGRHTPSPAAGARPRRAGKRVVCPVHNRQSALVGLEAGSCRTKGRMVVEAGKGRLRRFMALIALAPVGIFRIGWRATVIGMALSLAASRLLVRYAPPSWREMPDSGRVADLPIALVLTVVALIAGLTGATFGLKYLLGI